MSESKPRTRIIGWLLDTLLIPLAVLIVLFEDVLWAGALALVRRIDALGPVRALHARLGALPASVALPLFLVPETISHLAGAYATVLLAQVHVVGATLMVVGVKGVSTLVVVWIYQACADTLLRVAWFAWLHGQALRIRDWAKAQVAPLRARARAWLAAVRVRLRVRSSAFGFYARLRLRAIRVRLSDWIATNGRR
jgi:hypothetical protein